MNLPTLRVSVAPGDAVVAREGNAVLVADPAGASQEAFLDSALSLLAEPQSRDGLVRKLAALVTQAAPEDVPSLGLVVSSGDQLTALLVGDMRVLITGKQGGDETLVGRDASTFVERIIRGDVVQLLLSADSAAVPDRRSNLSGGVVRGAGCLVVPVPRAIDLPDNEETLVDLAQGPVAAEDPEPATSVSTSPPASVADEPELVAQITGQAEFESISLLSDDEGDGLAQEPSTVDAPGDTNSVLQVHGIVCSRGHFNDPNARFCSRCGISMVHQTHHLVLGARPPLGVVVADDGTVFALVTDYVLGREPENAPDAMSGAAVPVSLEDPGLLMSRVHARILLDGWEVRVEDAHSANGTFLAESAEKELVRLDPGVPVTIRPGARIRLGGRTLTFESHQRS